MVSPAPEGRRCPQCGSENLPEATSCEACATTLPPLLAVPLGASSKEDVSTTPPTVPADAGSSQAPRRCLYCNALNLGTARVCDRCRRPLGPGTLTPSREPRDRLGTLSSAPRPAFVPLPFTHHDARRVRERERTFNGLLLMMVGIALGWVPYVSFLGGVLALIGLLLVFLGRHGFEGPHSTYVVVGALIFVLVLFATFFVTLSFDFSLSSLLNANPSGGSVVSSQISSAFDSYLEGVVFLGSIGALTNVLVAFGLADRVSRTLLLLAFVLSVAVALLVLLLLLPQVNTAIAQSLSPGALDPAPVLALANEVPYYETASVVPDLLLAYAYWRTRAHAMSIAYGRSAGTAPISEGPVP